MTNAERSAATRQKLLEAATQSLIEVGFSQTSNQAVCRRAGISNGSLLHHFRTRRNLMGGTLEWIADRLVERFFEQCAQSQQQEGDPVDRLLDALWPIFESDDYKALIELWVACGRDPELLERVKPLIDYYDVEFDPRKDVRFAQYFPELTRDPDFFRVTLEIMLSVMDGVAIELFTYSTKDLPQFKDAVRKLFKLAFAAHSQGQLPSR